jgi:hypothetical protein
MLWNAKEARLYGVRVSSPGCRDPSELLPTRGWSPRTGLALYGELGTVTFRCTPRRSRRPCHPHAMSSSHEQYAAVNHGHSRRPLRWTPAP